MLLRFDQLDSTHDEARRQLGGGATAPFGVICGEQVSGRGRLNRPGVSAPAAGVYLTSVHALSSLPPNITMTPIVVGCGVADWLNGLGLSVQLKWPNDLRVDRAKLGGILCEVVGNHLLIGVGINWSSAPTLDDQPTTFVEAHGASSSSLGAAQDQAYAAVTAAVSWWRGAGDERARARWWALAERQLVRVGDLIGEPIGLAPSGALRLRTDTGAVHEVHAGDVLEVSSR